MQLLFKWYHGRGLRCPEFLQPAGGVVIKKLIMEFQNDSGYLGVANICARGINISAGEETTANEMSSNIAADLGLDQKLHWENCHCQ